MQQSNFYSTYTKMSAINVNFYLNNYEKKDGTHQVLLTLTSESKRKRLALDLFVKKSDWNAKKQRVKPKVKNARDYNLIISQAESKITDIKVFYRLNEAHLTLDKLIDEFLLSSPSFDFISFMIFHIKKAPIKESTRKGQLSRANRLKQWKETISFSNITIKLLDEYRHYLENDGLCRNTINTHFKTIAKYLRLAKKYGVKLNVDLDQLEVKNIRSNRVSLTQQEIKKLWEYWDSSFCAKRHRLPVGYFLFVCKTGLRLSEWKSLRREDFKETHFIFFNSKSNKYIRYMINNSVRRLLESEPELFHTFKSDQKMRDYLKEACKIVGIKKRIDFHTGRHTFATHFSQKGGMPVDLQNLLGHSDLKTTMIYYHPNNTGSIDTTIVD